MKWDPSLATVQELKVPTIPRLVVYGTSTIVVSPPVTGFTMAIPAFRDARYTIFALSTPINRYPVEAAATDDTV